MDESPPLSPGQRKSEYIPFSGTSKFHGIISNSFEPYLTIYVDSEDKNILDMINSYKLKKEAEAEDSLVLSSSADLFYYYRQSLQNCYQLTNKKPLHDLFKVFAKYIGTYCDFLLTRLPTEIDMKRTLNKNEFKTICIVLNTAEYAQNTCTQVKYN